MTKNFMTTVQGVSNVYSQHVPVLMDLIQSATKGRLKLETHPFVDGGSRGTQPETVVPEEIIVFIAGGVTYEEATKISEFNETNPGGIRIVLGGSTVHNSTSFLDELKSMPL